MPDPLFGLITPACYDTLLVQRDLLGPAGIDCAKKVVAKLLGTAILFGSFALKLPQIFKILKARSALGLNPTSQYLEASRARGTTARVRRALAEAAAAAALADAAAAARARRSRCTRSRCCTRCSSATRSRRTARRP